MKNCASNLLNVLFLIFMLFHENTESFVQYYAFKQIAKKVGLQDKLDETAKMLLNMYALFVKKDALLIEINPYAEDAAETCKFVN